MRAFADSSERIYDNLDKGMKKKGAGRKCKKTTKTRQKRRFRAIEKRNIEIVLG